MKLGPCEIFYEKWRILKKKVEGVKSQKDLSSSVIDWLMEHRTADSIEEVTEEMLVAVS